MSNQDRVPDTIIKSSVDHSYNYHTLVRHQGVILAFAMDSQRQIYYSVLNLKAQKYTTLDVNFWSTNPKLLRFPNEITEVGFGVTDQTLLPTVKKSSDVSHDTASATDIHEFLSTTARLTADAPFQVMSDGQFVYVLRQAIAASHPDTITVSGPQGHPVAIVDSTLLLDRFILSGIAPAAAASGQPSPEPELLTSGDRIDLGGAEIKLGQRFSQEAWIFLYVTPQMPNPELQQPLLGTSQNTADAPPSVRIVNNRKLRVGFGDGERFCSFITDNVLMKRVDMTQSNDQMLDINAELVAIQTLQAQVNEKSQALVNLSTDLEFCDRVLNIIDNALANRPTGAVPTSEPKGFDILQRLPGIVSTLQSRRNQLSALQRELSRLQQLLNDANVSVFEYSGFGGRSLVLNDGGRRTGFFGCTFLNANGFNDIISSIRLPRVVTQSGTVINILEVTAFVDANRGGRSRVYTSSGFVGGDFNDIISSIEVRVNAAFQNVLNTANDGATTAQQKLNEAIAVLQGLRTSLNVIRQTKETELRQITQSWADLKLQLRGKTTCLNSGFQLKVPLAHADAVERRFSEGFSNLSGPPRRCCYLTVPRAIWRCIFGARMINFLSPTMKF